MKIIILHNQSLLDLALQHTGKVENAFELAMVNELSITDSVEAGERLELPENIAQERDILAYYQAKNIQPATAVSHTGNTINKPEGISYWAINQDFKVS